MFGVFHSMGYHEYRAGNDTIVGVVSCSASFTQTRHEMTPILVSFHAQCLLYALPCTSSTKWHPCWCHFMLRSFPGPLNKLRGVFIKYFIILLYIFNSIYLIQYRAHGNFARILHLWMWDGNSAGAGVGQPKSPHRTPVSITRHQCVSIPLIWKIICWGLLHSEHAKQSKANLDNNLEHLAGILDKLDELGEIMEEMLQTQDYVEVNLFSVSQTQQKRTFCLFLPDPSWGKSEWTSRTFDDTWSFPWTVCIIPNGL